MSKPRILPAEHLKHIYDGFGAKQDSQAYYEDPAFDCLIAHGSFDDALAIFEFGCGTGRQAARLLSRHLPQQATYIGVDISPVMVRLAKGRLRAFPNPIAILRTDGSMSLPVGTGRIDRFLCVFVLDLLSDEDARALIREAHRTLKPGGLLCLASLTKGRTLGSSLISLLWTIVHHFKPEIVGGCRPVRLKPLLDEGCWQIKYQNQVAPYGIASQVLIATKSRNDT